MGSAAQTIEAHFKPLHDYVVGNWAGVAPIDRLLMHIEDLAEALNDHSNGQLSDEAISNAKSALDGIAADESKTPGWVAGLTRQAIGSLAFT